MRQPVIALLLLVTALVTACSGGKIYDRYADVTVSGWGKRDSIAFDVPRVSEPGVYNIVLGTRITSTYPFKSMTLVVRTVRYPGGKVSYNSVPCPLVSDSGHPLGEGVSVFENSYPVCSQQLNEGDSLHISVTHNMRLEDLPGITAIGVSVSKAE